MIFSIINGDQYQLLEALLPGIGLFILLWVDLVELSRLRVHHGTCVLENLHVESLPADQIRSRIKINDPYKNTTLFEKRFSIDGFDIDPF